MLLSSRLLLAVPFLLLVSSVLGQEPAGKGYPLARPPLAILDGLVDLKMGTVPPLPAEERALLEKVWTLRGEKKFAPMPVDDALLVEALLFACGVDEASKRKGYRERLDAITTAAKEATNPGKTPAGRAELLLRHLHKTALKAGYAAEQSLLTATLDTGKYNCVSSTVLYYLVGHRLGLTLQPVAVPGGPFLAGHAAIDLIGDRRIQIETTSPDGFDWEMKVKQPGVVVVGIVPDRKGAVEVDGLDLAAMTYTNRAVACTREKMPRRLAAARCDLAALALSPTSATAAHNAIANFSNWGLALTAEGKHEDAVRVLGFARTFAPKSSELANNYTVVWGEYILSLLHGGKDREAVAVIRRAAKALPREMDFSHESEWFGRLGEEKIKKEEWEAGLAVVERGLAVLSDSEKDRLKAWRGGAFRRWSQALLEKKDYTGSMKVLARAYKLDPKDSEILDGVAYHTQEALKLADAKGGLKEARAHFTAIKQQFPEAKEAVEIGAAFARRKVAAVAKEMKFAEALKLADECTPLFLNGSERAEAGATVYDTWAQALVGMGKLETVLAKYAEGLKMYPKNDRLINNSLAAVDSWANPSIEAARWDDAIAAYKTGLKYFPDSAHLKNNLAFCEKRKGKKP